MLSNFVSAGFQRMAMDRSGGKDQQPSNGRRSGTSEPNSDYYTYEMVDSPAIGGTTNINAATTMTRPVPARSQQQQVGQDQSRIWRSAVDPKTGRTYYYDVLTRETQWRKPIELATEEERLAMERKEKKQKEFFASMERNIMRNLAQGVFGPVPKPEDEERDGLGQLRVNGRCDNSSIIKNNLVQNESAKGTTARPTRAVRTISSMDQNVLAELTRVDKENMHLGVSCPASVSKQQRVSPTSVIVTGNRFEFCDPTMFIRDAHRRSATDSTVSSDDEEEKERAIAEVERVAQEMAQLELSPASSNSNSEPRNESAIACATGKLNRPILRKRNTCSTLYVGSTMSAPDKDATIKCICGVFRAHLLQSVREKCRSIQFDEYEIFNDVYYSHGFDVSSIPVPSLEDITNFYRDVFRKSQMEADCIIMSLIYVERIIKETNGGVRPHPGNWRSILFSSMILASKVWDDLSMWNSDFSHCVSCRDSGVRFSLQRINELERATLSCLKYNVKVAASEYAKYYFLLRSMLIRSGLGGKDLNSLAPLDIEGAKQLELRSASAEQTQTLSSSATSRELSALTIKPRSRRSKSLGNVALGVIYGSDSSPEREFKTFEHGRSPASVRANLEQVVHM